MTDATWMPDPATVDLTRMVAFRCAASDRSGTAMESTVDLHRWSLEDPDGFWSLVWEFFGVVGERGDRAHVPTTLPQAVFFPDARVNLAENLLSPWTDSDEIAVVVCCAEGDEVVVRDSLTGRDLVSRVASVASFLRESGVTPGDRVALVMPVGIDALACTLGSLAVGAIVSSVSPEFGARAILDRLGQLEPAVLLAVTSYVWHGRPIDRSEVSDDVVAGLPSLRVTVVDGIDTIMNRDAAPEYAPVSFDHPAYVLFSSGTTGRPKCLVHRGGGVLLKHLVEIGLHADVRPGDRMLFYTTTSWMMWNWLISTLALGASVVLWEESPTHPRPDALVEAARLTGTTHLGVSARLLDHLRTESVALSGSDPTLREVLVTGSPLSVPTATWLAAQLGPRVMINPISGGTDLVGVFVGGDPTRPFHAGEMAGPMLGTAVDVFTDDGVPAEVGEPGELVCTQPFPTVPVGIWGDASGERLHATYFDRWPGVWVHGDRAVRTPHGGIAILGRSDATLNVGGVRIGTAEIYAALADVPDVVDSLAFGQEWDGDTRIVLLVVLQGGAVSLSDDQERAIRTAIRSHCSPRHVPAVILAVPDLPRTQTGKISELAVREAVHGREVPGRAALANPEVLEVIVTAVRSAL